VDVSIAVIGKTFSRQERRGKHTEPENQFETAKARVGRRKATEIHYRTKQRNALNQWRSFVLIENGVVIRISLTCPAGEEKAFARDFESILRSVRFKS